MSIEETLTDITARLRQGKFPNEQAVSQGIVLRLLHELGWNTWDTTVVWPEFQTGEGRPDFALCHPPSKPAVFIEVKQPGGAEDGVRQALEYAFHTGVPLVVPRNHSKLLAWNIALVKVSLKPGAPYPRHGASW